MAWVRCMVPVNDFWILCMIRGKRCRGRELEIKYVLTCLASPQERGLFKADRRPARQTEAGDAWKWIFPLSVIKMQVTGAPSDVKCAAPQKERKEHETPVGPDPPLTQFLHWKNSQ